MQYISDKTVFSAVNFSLKLIRDDGKDLDKAVEIASNYYKCESSHVMYYVTCELGLDVRGTPLPEQKSMKDAMRDTGADQKTIDAAKYACELMRSGTNPGLAFHKASVAYGVDAKVINKHVSQFGGRKAKANR